MEPEQTEWLTPKEVHELIRGMPQGYGLTTTYKMVHENTWDRIKGSGTGKKFPRYLVSRASVAAWMARELTVTEAKVG